MKCKGMLLTPAVIILGAVIMVFAIVQNNISKSHELTPNLMDLERTSTRNSNIAHNLAKIYKTSAKMNVTQTQDSITVRQSLPNDFSQYQLELSRMRDFLSHHMPDTTFSTPTTPRIHTGAGVNVTQTSERSLRIDVPGRYRIVDLELVGGASVQITDCNYTYENGGDTVRISLQGVDGGECAITRGVNASDRLYFDLNSGAVRLEMYDGVLYLTNELPTALNYELRMVLNETAYPVPMKLEGWVQTVSPPAKKWGEIPVKW
jgi:hypothetical protein